MTIDIDELERMAAGAQSFDPSVYASEYEFRGDGGDYTPKEHERILIEDAVSGAVGPLVSAIRQLTARVRELEAENLHLQTLNKGGHEIVSRIWTIFGTPSYEELAGLTIYDLVQDALARAEKAEAEVERLREALTPSGDTKAAYIGEFSYREEIFDGETETYLTVCRVVPWTTIKEIMGAISARAAINGDSNG